jgi:hypothetical protein
METIMEMMTIMKIRIINKNKTKPNPLLNLRKPPQTDPLQQLAIDWVRERIGENQLRQILMKRICQDIVSIGDNEMILWCEMFQRHPHIITEKDLAESRVVLSYSRTNQGVMAKLIVDISNMDEPITTEICISWETIIDWETEGGDNDR